MPLATHVVGVIKLEVSNEFRPGLGEETSPRPEQDVVLQRSLRFPRRIERNSHVPTIHVQARLADLYRELHTALEAFCEQTQA